LSLFYSQNERPQKNDDGELVDRRVVRNWHPSLPPAPRDFPRNASLRLTAIEGEYLRERILTHVSQSMLAFLVNDGQVTASTDFPWAHPQVAEFPTRIREQLEHARNFSESIHGAALLYNLMLAEEAHQEDLIEEYRERLRRWASSISMRQVELLSWDRRRFWEIIELDNQRIKHPTRLFVDGWLDLVLPKVKAINIAVDNRARQLIRDRERQLKRGQARLDNIRARELWNEEAGTKQLSYRWPVAQTIVQDILTALSENESHA
jgi:Family of unknown function (DUF6361)